MKLLTITLPGSRVGALSQTRQGLTCWTPDLAWEQAGQEPRLGLDFLRKLGPRTHASELPCWFENLLPERGSELRARLAAQFKLREGQSFDLLRVTGQDLIGAVEARDAAGAIGTPEANEDIDHGTAAPPEESLRLSALTGMQLKFTMSMANERLTLPARQGESLWIVKLSGREYPDLAHVEAATMTWARLAGFPVPDHFAAPFDWLTGVPPGWADDAQPVYAVRRFDRRDDGSKVHQEDLCQALEIRPSNKYGDRDPRVTLEGAIRAVTDACGEQDGRDMARRIGFMIASGNTDAHLKNWSLVWGERLRPTLSPCYDLVASISWPRLGWERPSGPDLALRLGRQRLFRNLSEDVLRTSAEQTGFAWFPEEVKSGVLRARAAWPEVEGEAPARMRSAILAHWKAVPLLSAIGLE